MLYNKPFGTLRIESKSEFYVKPKVLNMSLCYSVKIALKFDPFLLLLLVNFHLHNLKMHFMNKNQRLAFETHDDALIPL